MCFKSLHLTEVHLLSPLVDKNRILKKNALICWQPVTHVYYTVILVEKVGRWLCYCYVQKKNQVVDVNKILPNGCFINSSNDSSSK